MSKKNTPFLDKYKELLECGKLDTEGLCKVVKNLYQEEKIDNTDLFELVSPTTKDCEDLTLEGYYTGYWASNDKPKSSSTLEDVLHNFGPLRQTLLLLMAALNDEL